MRDSILGWPFPRHRRKAWDYRCPTGYYNQQRTQARLLGQFASNNLGYCSNPYAYANRFGGYGYSRVPLFAQGAFGTYNSPYVRRFHPTASRSFPYRTTRSSPMFGRGMRYLAAATRPTRGYPPSLHRTQYMSSPWYQEGFSDYDDDEYDDIDGEDCEDYDFRTPYGGRGQYYSGYGGLNDYDPDAYDYEDDETEDLASSTLDSTRGRYGSAVGYGGYRGPGGYGGYEGYGGYDRSGHLGRDLSFRTQHPGGIDLGYRRPEYGGFEDNKLGFRL